MVIAIASAAVDMNPVSGNSTYLVSTLTSLAAAAATSTANQINVLDPQNCLQQYLGSFDLGSLALGSFATSTFTGFKLYSTPTASEASLLYEVSGASLNGQLIAAAATTGTSVTLISTLFEGDDQISASASNPFNDNLLGFAGNDAILGGAGLDSIEGGAGNDTIRGGLNEDRIFGDTDNDRLNGNQGNDTSVGGLGADVFLISKGVDVIADFNPNQGDTLAVIEATLPAGGLAAALSDSASGLVLTRDGFGTTTLTGWTVATFDLTDVTLL